MTTKACVDKWQVRWLMKWGRKEREKMKKIPKSKLMEN